MYDVFWPSPSYLNIHLWISYDQYIYKALNYIIIFIAQNEKLRFFLCTKKRNLSCRHDIQNHIFLHTIHGDRMIL